PKRKPRSLYFEAMTNVETSPTRENDDLPAVSDFLPLLNEERDHSQAAERILEQKHAGPYEDVLAVEQSEDRTMKRATEPASRDQQITVVDNPTGATPAGLNIAVKAAKHDILVRVDGHSAIPDHYVANCV